MRDINRIPEFLEKLQQVWLHNPDMRFFQLVDFLSGGRDLFHQEDDIVLQILDYNIESYKKLDYYRENKALIYKDLLGKIEDLFVDKVDKGGNPYINHLLYVSSKQESIDGKIIGLLHEVLEDIQITTVELNEWGLPYYIFDKIELLTRNKNTIYEEYINKIVLMGDKEVINVKITDLEHDMDIKRIGEQDKETIENLIQERYIPAYNKLKQKYKRILDEEENTR